MIWYMEVFVKRESGGIKKIEGDKKIEEGKSWRINKNLICN